MTKGWFKLYGKRCIPKHEIILSSGLDIHRLQYQEGILDIILHGYWKMNVYIHVTFWSCLAMNILSYFSCLFFCLWSPHCMILGCLDIESYELKRHEEALFGWYLLMARPTVTWPGFFFEEFLRKECLWRVCVHMFYADTLGNKGWRTGLEFLCLVFNTIITHCPQHSPIWNMSDVSQSSDLTLLFPEN